MIFIIMIIQKIKPKNLFLNEKTENVILRHMFPLNIVPPKNKEAWLITFVDKYVSCEVFPYLLKKVGRKIIHG